MCCVARHGLQKSQGPFFLRPLFTAMYEGDSRVRTVDISVDGSLVTTWTSSGTTTDFEGINLSGTYGQEITITGKNLADSDWLSVIEVGPLMVVVVSCVFSPPDHEGRLVLLKPPILLCPVVVRSLCSTCGAGISWRFSVACFGVSSWLAL